MLTRDAWNRIYKLASDCILPQHVNNSMPVLWDLHKHAIHMAQQFEPIPPGFDDDLDVWLDKTTYTSKQKEGFRKILLDSSSLGPKDTRCKCFTKAETYPEYKFPRPIKSRSDRYKAIMGPIFQGINEQLFKNKKWFIKKTPVEDRPRVLKDLLFPSEIYKCTDFSSFEAHFLSVMIYVLEFPLYYWMTQHLQGRHYFKNGLEVLLEPNECIFKDFFVVVSSRASGEMNTSSGNGFSDLVLSSYIPRVKGAEQFDAQFEGDDSISRTIPANLGATTQDFLDLGWSCKVVDVKKFEEASFCGIVADIDDLVNVCDVRAYLADFGWTRQQYLNSKHKVKLALIRAKGYSAIYQYPKCPIIYALGHYALRVTNSNVIHDKFLKMVNNNKIADSRYKNKVFLEFSERYKFNIPPREAVPENTRYLVDSLYKITPEKQIEVETYLDSLTAIHPLLVELDVPHVWKHAWSLTVMEDGLVQVPMDEIEEFRKFIGAFSTPTVKINL